MEQNKEIGGFIEFEYFHGEEFHKNAIALNIARNCLAYIVIAKKIKHLHLPYFLCNTATCVCEKYEVDVEYYHIDKDWKPLLEDNLSEDEWIYIVNYYGQLNEKCLLDLKKKYGNIIIDNVQAFFQKPIKGIDTIYTCRKFFGVPDGAYLYTDKKIDFELEKDNSNGRVQHLLGRLEFGAQPFYNSYVNHEEQLSQEKIKKMSKFTRNILKGMPYEKIAKVRQNNFAYLHDKLGKINLLELEVPYGAFMYPLYVKNGEKIRKKLQKNRIYIPTLWPNVLEMCTENELEYDLAKNILPLPVDQRYTLEDMQYIINKINENL